MFTDSHPAASQRAGRILSAPVAFALLVDAANTLFSKSTTQAELAATGFADNAAPALGIITLVCAILYAVPQTAVLGAILVTGFLGGAICTHFRLGELGSPPQIISLVLGLMAWGGLYLRNAHVRSLLPFTA
jgi:DoxX-like family